MSDQMAVAYQGEPGAYSQMAVMEMFGSGVKAVGLSSFDDVFKAVESGKYERALLPFENTLGGSIHRNYDLLLLHNLHVIGEHRLRVRHNLLALPGVKKGDIKEVASHPQALAQCDEYINQMGCSRSPAYDTAGSAKILAENGRRDHAAIASEIAATVYGLEILDAGIEDEPNNYTRFLLLSQQPVSPVLSLPSKTSVVFSVYDTPGVLFKALSVFALRDIDLTKIESRPGHRRFYRGGAKRQEGATTPAKSGKAESSTVFYLDFLAASSEERVVNALRHLQEVSPFVRVLGSYNTTMESSSQPLLAPAGEEAGTPVLHRRAPSQRLKIGIVGFGSFGQFIAKAFVEAQHTVYATSRTDYTDVALSMGILFTPDIKKFAAQDLDVVVFAVSILSFEKVISNYPLDTLAGKLIVDVLSVKVHPKELMLKLLPESCDIVCTHPMFGPTSGKNGWDDLPLVYEKVRVRDFHRAARFLSLWEEEGCRMVNMTCEKHDEHAAGSQFVTHLVGRMLSNLGVANTPINTKGFEFLLELVDNTCKDSFDLFQALYLHNPASHKQLDLLEDAVARMRAELAVGNDGSTDLNPRILSMKGSETAKITDAAKELIRQDKDVIMLSVGEPDYPPPPAVIQAVTDAVQQGHTKYTNTAGSHDLRVAIAEKLKKENGLDYGPTDIVCSNGGKQALFQTISVLCRPGDEVLVCAPHWVSYPAMVHLAGATPVIIRMRREDDYILKAADLEDHITAATRAVVMCSPSNPTGSVHSAKDLEALASVLRRHPRVVVISDEIYEKILFDGATHTSFASLDGMFDRTVTINGFSKAYAMTGFRLGYLAASPALGVAQAVVKLQSQISSCPSSISQRAAIAALTTSEDYFVMAVKNLKEKRAVVIDALASIDGVEMANVPQGAFYVFFTVRNFFGRATPSGRVIGSAKELCEHLIEDHFVALVPGGAFGDPDCIRISYASNLSKLELAMDRLKKCLGALK